MCIFTGTFTKIRKLHGKIRHHHGYSTGVGYLQVHSLPSPFGRYKQREGRDPAEDHENRSSNGVSSQRPGRAPAAAAHPQHRHHHSRNHHHLLYDFHQRGASHPAQARLQGDDSHIQRESKTGTGKPPDDGATAGGWHSDECLRQGSECGPI